MLPEDQHRARGRSLDHRMQPNRFEIALGQSWHKLYIDGNLAKPELSDRLQDVTDTPVLSGEVFGVPIKFQRVNNPHSGCFFLNARQMQHWSERPEFLNRDPSFAGPLESAATLGIMHFFRAYKPARENAGFLSRGRRLVVAVQNSGLRARV